MGHGVESELLASAGALGPRMELGRVWRLLFDFRQLTDTPKPLK